MKRLSPLGLPLAVTLALLSGASAAQDRPNTTLVQKAKASPVSSSKAKGPAPSAARLSGTSETGDLKRAPRTSTTPAMSTQGIQHDCHGLDSDA
jgi:hypothetical protein